MTKSQITLANSTLAELRQLAPNVKWHVSYNYYTKLPAFSAIKDGGVQYDMYRRAWRGDNLLVDLEATVNMAAHETNHVTVWPDVPRPVVTKKIERVNFKKYIEFVKDNLGLLERIGA